jgi:hypothetical protein
MGHGAYWWVALDNARHPERYDEPAYQVIFAVSVLLIIVVLYKMRADTERQSPQE